MLSYTKKVFFIQAVFLFKPNLRQDRGFGKNNVKKLTICTSNRERMEDSYIKIEKIVKNKKKW